MDIDELELRNGLFYQKSSDKPFTGKVSGKEDGEIIEGKREGTWIFYYENGVLKFKGNYKQEKANGIWVHYSENGQLLSKGNWKDDKLIE